ncbi:hypothetical protein P7H20_25660 [Paenibacillus larvae]|nr:hypothetical protein [Paenibacillus larvae]MDT2277553.1 hypothetical protein [Paenibacillus larvae]
MLMRIISRFAACKQIQDSGFASEGEWKDIDSVDDDLCRFIIKHSGAYTAVDLGEIKLSPFRTHHDAYEPLGYAIERIV